MSKFFVKIIRIYSSERFPKLSKRRMKPVQMRETHESIKNLQIHINKDIIKIYYPSKRIKI